MKLAFRDHVRHLILSNFQAMFVATTEENRCETELRGVVEAISNAQGPKMRLIAWDGHRGFSVVPDNKKNVMDPIAALDTLFGEDPNTGQSKYWGDTSALFVFRGLHDFCNDATTRQTIRNLVVYNGLNCYPTVTLPSGKEVTGYRRPLLIMAPTKKIHPDIAHCLTVVPFPLADYDQLAAIFDEMAATLSSLPPPVAPMRHACSADLRERIIQSMRGLREREAEDILSMSLRINKGFNTAEAFDMPDGRGNPGVAEVVEDEKAATLQKSEVLSYVGADKLLSQADIGGNDVMKAWIARKAIALGPLGKKHKLDAPRGVVLIGPPGCLHGDTIIDDPVAGTRLTVQERYDIGSYFYVLSRDPATGDIVQTEAQPPDKYPAADMLRLTLEDGRQITVTAGHLFWDGAKYVSAGDLAELCRDAPYPLATIGDTAPSTRS